MFRKAHYETEMPEFVRTTFRPSDANIIALRRSIRSRYKDFDVEEHKRLLDQADRYAAMQAVSVEDIRTTLASKWTKLTQAEVQATIEILVKEGFLKPVFTSIYGIVPEPRRRSSYVQMEGRWRGRQEQKEFRRSGVCPTCGKHTSNKNRHGNSAHRAEECKLNQIQDVLEG